MKFASGRRTAGETRERKIRSAYPLSLGDAVFFGGLALLVLYALWLGRDLSFFSDDWPMIAFYHTGNYLRPYNGHLIILPLAIFRALFVTVGLSSYTPYRFVGLVGYAWFGILLYFYARRRVSPFLAALAALSIVWLSGADTNVLFPPLISFTLALSAGILMWSMLDRDTIINDICAGVALAVALASIGAGLPFVAAVAAENLALRRPLRRWLPFGPPVALWLLWYAQYHETVAAPGSISATLRYFFLQLEATFAAFAAGWTPGGYLLFGTTLVVSGLAAWRWHTFNARATGALVGLLSFAALTSYARVGIVPAAPPDTGRYLWVNAFFLVAALLEFVRGRKLPLLVPAVGALCVTVSAFALVSKLQTYREQVIRYEHTTRTFMVAVQAIPDQIDRTRIMPLSYILVRAGDYLDAVDHLGSPIAGVGLDDLGSDEDRRRADEWMVQDLRLGLVPRDTDAGGRCDIVPTTPRGVRDGEVRGEATVVIQAGDHPAPVWIRRLAYRYPTEPFGYVNAGQTAALHIPSDRSSFPWHVGVGGKATTSMTICH